MSVDEKQSTRPSSTSGENDPFSVMASLAAAQFQLFETMGQCTLAWATLPFELAVPSSTNQEARVQETARASSPAARYHHAAAGAGFAWPAFPPVITGLEDTVNDQVFKPRPNEIPQRDILTLWKRSNEFGDTAATNAGHELHDRSRAA